MDERFRCRCLPVLVGAATACAAFSFAGASSANEGESIKGASTVEREAPVAKPKLDLTGRKRVGIASVYARRFAGKKMADGTRMDPHDDNAASKTLPLGTEAKVTNLKTGQSATVTIQDRGPYVKGRIVDLSPATADKIGITPKEGITKVEVAPTAAPRESGP